LKDDSCSFLIALWMSAEECNFLNFFIIPPHQLRFSAVDYIHLAKRVSGLADRTPDLGIVS